MNFILGALKKEKQAQAGSDLDSTYHPPSSTLMGLSAQIQTVELCPHSYVQQK